LIHFAKPYHHAQHYLGCTKNISLRMAKHEAGTGARLIQVIQAHGIRWEVVRQWVGGRELELKLKAFKNSRRLCPICRGKLERGAQ
jgi:predicted GIY-YIG superfamily endonuclease